MIIAFILTAAITVEVDLGGLIRAHRVNQWRRDALKNPPRVTCGIRDVGFRFFGEPGVRVRFCRATYVIPPSGQLELVSGKVRGSFDCREVPDGASEERDQYGFRDVRP